MKCVLVEEGRAGNAKPVVSNGEIPVPKKGEVLVRVRSTCLGPSCLSLYGSEYKSISRKLRNSKAAVSGIEFSGVATQDSGKFKKDDEVVGAVHFLSGTRTHAEYTVIPEDYLVAKPGNLTHREIASMIIGPLVAIEALGNIPNSEGRVLINGASGGVGVYGIQMAKHLGYHITASASPKNHEALRSIGANIAIDYRSEGLLDGKYDVIFDVAGKLSWSKCKDSLQDGGVYINTEPQKDLKGFLCSIFSKRKSKLVLVLHSGKGRMKKWEALIGKGVFTPVIDSVYSLDEIAVAVDYYQNSSALGKVVIDIDGEQNVNAADKVDESVSI